MKKLLILIAVMAVFSLYQFNNLPSNKVPDACLNIGDRIGYHIPAVNLLNGYGYKTYYISPESEYNILHRDQDQAEVARTRTDWMPECYRPPGYSFFLAMVYSISHPSERCAYVAHVIIFGLTLGMLFLLSLRYSPVYVAWIPSVALFINRSFDRFMPVALSEIYATFLVVFMSLMATWKRWLITGFLCAWLVLTRGNMIFMVPVVVMWLYFNDKKNLKRFIVGFSLLFVPWTIYASCASGKFVIVSQSGKINFVLGSVDQILNNPPGDVKMRVNQRPQEWGSTRAEQSKTMFSGGWKLGLDQYRNSPELIWPKAKAKVKFMWRGWSIPMLAISILGLWRMQGWMVSFPFALLCTAVMFFGNPRFVLPIYPILMVGLISAVFYKVKK